MKTILAILTMLIPGCVQHSTNSSVSVPIVVNLSIVPATDFGGVRR